MSEHYRVADYIADFLADRGVTHIFLLPGGGAMFLNDAVAKHEKLKGIACFHEQACTIAAEAYSRVNNHLGVAMLTTGPGGTNGITGVAGAWIESVPMLVISGQVKRPDLLGDSPLRQKGVQEVDIVSLVSPITKYAKLVLEPSSIQDELVKAFDLALSGRQGPVWLDIPLDVQASPCQPFSRIIVPKMINPLSNFESQFNEIKKMLAESKRPLILAGHGIRLSGGAEKFTETIEKIGIPVVTTWNALDLLPHEHPLCFGRPGVVALRYPNFAVQNCDLLISIGSRLDNIITAYNSKGFARGAKKIVVDIDPNEIEKLDMEIDIKLPIDAKEFLESISSFDRPQISHWLEKCQHWKSVYGKDRSHSNQSPEAISHYDFVETLSDALPEKILISTGSSGLAIEFFYTLFKNKLGQRVFLTSGLGSMGYGLPAAIGSCLSNGSKPIVALESDGSLQLNIQELATLKSLNLPVCLIIMNNHGYASIRNTQRNYFSSRFIGTGPEAGVWMPDLEKIASAYEIGYQRITQLSDLKPKIRQALDQKLPIIIDVHLESNATLAPKVSAIIQESGKIISMPLEDMTPLLSLGELNKEMLIPLLPESVAARENK